MKRATTSLPVPDSPVSRTVVSVGATLAAWASTSRHRFELAERGGARLRRSSSRGQRLDALLEPGRALARLGRPALLLGQPLVGEGEGHVIGDPRAAASACSGWKASGSQEKKRSAPATSPWSTTGTRRFERMPRASCRSKRALGTSNSTGRRRGLVARAQIRPESFRSAGSQYPG